MGICLGSCDMHSPHACPRTRTQSHTRTHTYAYTHTRSRARTYARTHTHALLDYLGCQASNTTGRAQSRPTCGCGENVSINHANTFHRPQVNRPTRRRINRKNTGLICVAISKEHDPCKQLHKASTTRSNTYIKSALAASAAGSSLLS